MKYLRNRREMNRTMIRVYAANTTDTIFSFSQQFVWSLRLTDGTHPAMVHTTYTHILP